MGLPATPSPSSRSATRALCRQVVNAVTGDLRWPDEVIESIITDGDTRDLVFRLAQEVCALEAERDSARALARILAHSYEHDSRPPVEVVRDALAFPVKP